MAICCNCYDNKNKELRKAKKIDKAEIREREIFKAKNKPINKIKMRSNHPSGKKSKAQIKVVRCKLCGCKIIAKTTRQADEIIKELKEKKRW